MSHFLNKIIENWTIDALKFKKKSQKPIKNQSFLYLFSSPNQHTISLPHINNFEPFSHYFGHSFVQILKHRKFVFISVEWILVPSHTYDSILYFLNSFSSQFLCTHFTSSFLYLNNICQVKVALQYTLKNFIRNAFDTYVRMQTKKFPIYIYIYSTLTYSIATQNSAKDKCALVIFHIFTLTHSNIIFIPMYRPFVFVCECVWRSLYFYTWLVIFGSKNLLCFAVDTASCQHVN